MFHWNWVSRQLSKKFANENLDIELFTFLARFGRLRQTSALGIRHNVGEEEKWLQKGKVSLLL